MNQSTHQGYLAQCKRDLARPVAGYSFTAGDAEASAALHRKTEPYIRTYTGRLIYPFGPYKENEYHIADIAHALSNLCRFTGHTLGFYSVAEHSLRCAAKFLDNPALALSALMHDASEAYLNDIASPTKKGLVEYQAIEGEIERGIATQYGLPWPMPPEVKRVDGDMVEWEKANIGPGRRFPTFEPLTSAEAKVTFLAEFLILNQ